MTVIQRAYRAGRALLARKKRRLYSTSSQWEEFDVVIVGGGPAGLALASALGSSAPVRESLKVALIEAGSLDKVRGWTPQEGEFSNRVSSITNSSRSFLRDIGVWDLVDTTRTTPVEEMQVWDGVSDSRITFSAAEFSLREASSQLEPPAMAYMTENFNLQRSLLRYLDTHSEIQLSDNVKVNSIRREDREGGGWPLVHVSDGRVLRARLLVGADGFNSPVRAYAGISSFGWSYDTQAIVATMFHAPRTAFQTGNTTAYQRFLPSGPIAFLPLSPTASSLVWSTNPTLASALSASEPAVLTSMVNAAFRLPWVSIQYLHDRILEGYTSGALLTNAELSEEVAWRERSHAIDSHSAYASASVLPPSEDSGIPPDGADALPPLIRSIQPGTMASFPLRFNHADAYIGEGAGARTALVGDAAHTVHPLAGQGLNLGLADVQALSACITNTVLQGGDIGARTALIPYTRSRYFENHKVMSATDHLHKLYASTAAPVVWARSVGLEVVNELDSVKSAIMMSAGAQPSLRGSGSDENARVWNMAADGVEILAKGVHAANLIGGGIREMVISNVRDLLSARGSRAS